MASKSLVKSREAAVQISNSVVDRFMQVTLAQEGVNSEQFKGALREAILANPGIVQCNESSLAMAIRKCCMMRVIPDGIHAAIVPFKGEAQMVPMVEGLKLAMAQELGADIRSGVICEGEDFEAVTGSHGTLQSIVIKQNVQTLLNRDPTKLAGAWCSIDVKGQEPFIVVIGKAEIDRARKSSATNKVWGPYPDRMAQKTVVKRAIIEYRYKRGSMSKRLDEIIAADAAATHQENMEEIAAPIDMGDAKIVKNDERAQEDATSARKEDPPKKRGRPPKKKETPQEDSPKAESQPEPPQEDDFETEEMEENGYLPEDDDFAEIPDDL
ncbi:MAG: recombinase RecT [Gammaproteobacteria bacterium]|nr:recombinase RecT [Gammaproteobacteria bacterium]